MSADYDGALLQLTITGGTSPVRRRPSTISCTDDRHRLTDGLINFASLTVLAPPILHSIRSEYLSGQSAQSGQWSLWSPCYVCHTVYGHPGLYGHTRLSGHPSQPGHPCQSGPPVSLVWSLQLVWSPRSVWSPWTVWSLRLM